VKWFAFFFVFLFAFSSALLLPIALSADPRSEYRVIDAGYLAAHMAGFCGEKVRATGTVCFFVSFYMYEDFWLSRAIPVVVRFAGLQQPLVNSSIEIYGVIEHCDLEGGFYYLNAQSWVYTEKHLPEFLSAAIIPLFMFVTLLAIIVAHEKLTSKSSQYIPKTHTKVSV
jgi:hypothetical protein